MPLFDWIRSDLHSLNLDWIISKIKTVEESEQGAVDAAADANASKTAAAASATAANNSKTAAAGSATAAAGSAAQAQALVDQLDTTIAQDVSDWLEDNLTPTSPPVDDTLTIQGAAADAKKTGDEISDLKTILNALNGRDITLVFEHGFISNGEDSVYWKESRVRTPFPIKLENDMSITALLANTYCAFVIAYYNDDLTYNRTVTWSRQQTIPKNTYFRLVLSLDYTVNNAESVENIVKAFSWNAVTDTGERLDALETETANIADFVGYEEVNLDNLITGKSIDTRDGGDYSGVQNWRRTKYAVPVEEGDIITYTGHAFSNCGGVCIYDADGAFMSSPVSNASSTVRFFQNEKVTIPSGGKYVICADASQSSANEADFKLLRKKKPKESDYEMTYVYVSASANASDAIGTKSIPFASILTANNYISENSESNRFTIILLNGTYTDMQTFYSGKDGTYQSGAYQGVVCKDYVYYESQDINNPQNCIIQWDGLAGFTSPQSYDDVFVYKCPFHICSVHTHVKGFKFVCKNLRYCMHIESSGYGRIAQWEVSNCIFDWSNCPDDTGNPNTPTIGMGTSHFENGYIHDCVLLNSTPNYAGSGIMTHDNRWASSNTPFMYKGARLKLENIDFGNNSIRVRTMIAPQYYSTKNIIEINGCDNIDMFSHAFLSGMTVKEWDDIVLGSNIADNQFDN